MMPNDTDLPGFLKGKFKFKTLSNGATDKTKVLCVLCNKEFAYHRSSSSMKYHLNSKHIASSAVSTTPDAAGKLRQTTLTENRRKLSKSSSETLTNAISKWIAMDSRPVNIVEDKGLMDAFRIASSDTSYTLPARRTVAV